MKQKYHLYPWEIILHRKIRSLRNTRIGRFVQKKVVDNPHLKIPFQAIPLWIASVLTGLVAVGYEHLFSVFEKTGKSIYNAAPWLVFVSAPLFFGMAWLLTVQIAPNAKGSGIPQLMAAVELAGTSRSRFVERFLSLRITIVKICSSLLLLLGGGAIGREGPTLQISGSVFEAVYRQIPEGWEKVSHKIMIITGGASGLAAAFNTPLGGIVYVIEELTKSHIARFRTAVFSAVIIAGMTAQNFLGAYLYLGYPRLSAFPLHLIWAVVLLAFLSGYFGAAFTWLLLWIAEQRKKCRKYKHHLLFIAVLSLSFAAMVFFAGPLAMGTGKGLINEILFKPESDIPWYLFPVRFLGAAFSFSVGAAGGIFATSLSSGAAFGNWMVGLLHIPVEHHNLLILVSMIAFLTGVTRTPFTAAILVLEMTDRHSAIFYFLLSGIISHIAAGMVMEKSFYEIQKDDYLDRLREEEQKNRKKTGPESKNLPGKKEESP